VSSIHRPRRPRASPLWQVVHHAWDDFLATYEKHHRRAMGPLRPDAVAAVRAFLRRLHPISRGWRLETAGWRDRIPGKFDLLFSSLAYRLKPHACHRRLET